MSSKKGFTVKELLIVICIFALMTVILAPFVKIVKKRANKAACANNLRTLSLGLHTYASEHDGTFPQTLGDLYPNYVKDEKVFDCPAVKRIGTKVSPDYDYTSNLSEESPTIDIIVQDKGGNHKKMGKNILRLGGTVDWIGERR